MDGDAPIGLTLRSFIGKELDDTFPMDQSPQEVRGWSIHGPYVEQLSIDDLITAYCIDANSGAILSPEPYVKYCDKWDGLKAS